MGNNQITVLNFGKPSHIAFHYWHRYDQENSSYIHANVSQFSSTINEDCDFYILGLNSTLEDQLWYLDCGLLIIEQMIQSFTFF